MAPNSWAFPACPKHGREKASSVARAERAGCELMSCKNINVTHARQDAAPGRFSRQNGPIEQMSEIENSLGTLRRKRGLSAIQLAATVGVRDRKSTRLNSSHLGISYAV